MLQLLVKKERIDWFVHCLVSFEIISPRNRDVTIAVDGGYVRRLYRL